MRMRTAAPRPTPVALLAAALAATLAAPSGAEAQDFRGDATTTFRYFELGPLARDSTPASQPQRAAATLLQDLDLTMWGFGVEGLSATVRLRGREEVGSEFVWPQAEDPVDLIEGYVQLNRGAFRVRAGRQRARSGLGFDSFDGLSVMAEPRRWLTAEVFGGRSLARGLHEPHHEALEGVEDFLLDRDAYLFGGSVGLRPEATTSLALRYQREIWENRGALLSERASADFRTGLLRPVRISGSLDYDFAFGRVGKAHVQARVPLLDGAVSLEAAGRRYVPYFDLWTIWGLFSPVAYHEARFRATWSPLGRLGLWGEAAFRSYGDTNTDPILGPLEDDAHRVGGGVRWEPDPTVDLSGSYTLESGAGSHLSTGEVSARLQVRPDLRLSLHGIAAQQIEEFRIGEGIVAGAGFGVSYDASDRFELSGGAALYRRLYENRPGQLDWNQVRAWTSVRVRLGSDPGARRRP